MIRSVHCGLAAAWLMGAASAGADSSPDRLEVLVSILPQKEFVERIGGDAVRVSVMVRPGESPATYEPRPSQLREAARADVYIAIGVPFERAWTSRLQGMFPRLQWIDSAAGIERLPLADGHCHAHGHGHLPGAGRGADEAGSAGLVGDPHIWLSPRRVRVMADTLCAALCDLRRTECETFEENRASFQREIDELDRVLRAGFATVERRTFLVFHPSWGYFARDYGLEMLAIEQGGQEPSARELAQVLRRAKERGVRDVFVQPEFSAQSARAVVDELGGEVIVLSPLAEDWLSNMYRVGAVLTRSLGGAFPERPATGGR